MTTSSGALSELPRSGEIVVCDLEWTAWEGSLERSWSGPGEYREVIQIGAVCLDAVHFRLVAVFDRLVRPVRNPILSDYITRLSGITNQRMLEEGVPLHEALAEFGAFIASRPVWCNGGDATVLRENCVMQVISCPAYVERIGNLRPLLARATGLPTFQLVSCELPELLGLGPGTDCHTGVGDALAIAGALAALRTASLL
jgi:inhibitor of KinA sporulation pathway (predicted exonuclease)